jgi:hypothetical protein
MRPAVLIAAWAVFLAAGFTVAGRTGLGTLLTVAFVLQVTPSIWTGYRADRPTGISQGTWMLILGELSCWASFGIHKSDPRLITLGLTGIAASVLMLTRIRRTQIEPRSPIRRPASFAQTDLGIRRDDRCVGQRRPWRAGLRRGAALRPRRDVR